MKKNKVKNPLISSFKKLGPGLITGVSDDDPSGIATYSQCGAKFGLAYLWVALLTYPLMYVIQEMCARIGIVASDGLTKVIKKYYPSYVLYLTILITIPAVILNIVADLSAMGALFNILFPSIPKYTFHIALTALIILSLVFLGYNKIEKILKYLCLALFCYFIVPFLVKQNPKEILMGTFIPHLNFDKDHIQMFIAILGTTISPYLFFWQSNMSLEHKNQKNHTDETEINNSKIDVNVGMLISNLAMYFIILTTGSVLFPQGINNINTVEDAAMALQPLAGDFAFILFTIGILGVGLIAIPVLAGTIGFIFSELFSWKRGLDKKFSEAKQFYTVIIVSLLVSLIVNFFDVDPIKTLILTATLYGLIAPFIIGLILLICNNKKIMGKNRNSLIINVVGVIVFLLMTGSAVFYLITLFI